MDFKHEPDTDFKRPEAISAKEAKEQVQALQKAIEYHDYLYYVKNSPEISDHTYDILFARLQELEETWPDLQSSDSPTQKVGAPPAPDACFFAGVLSGQTGHGGLRQYLAEKGVNVRIAHDGMEKVLR